MEIRKTRVERKCEERKLTDARQKSKGLAILQVFAYAGTIIRSIYSLFVD